MNGIIVITSGKGGVGKSTVSANLAVLFAYRGKNVCVVDMDMGLRSQDMLLGLENKVVYDLTDVLDGTCRLKQAVLKSDISDNLSLLNANQMISCESVSEESFISLMKRLREHFDMVLIDCPAGIGRGFRSAVSAADAALLISTPDAVALRDIERVTSLVRNLDVPDQGLVMNRVTRRQIKKGCEVSPEEFSTRTGLRLLGMIPEYRSMYMAGMNGKPAVLEKDRTITRAFNNLADRIEGKNAPFNELKLSLRFKAAH